ncbi:hypothetical protein CDAR_167601 [Caerostris darwini]|uniref:Uncharacterized protein n=1 Tax=Caerostris darwini TaxID=1538125 RepID=A0AAV4MBG0_9ARAC|nr:hypothetical protein CDAR_167601 [Caerostris darwini]
MRIMYLFRYFNKTLVRIPSGFWLARKMSEKVPKWAVPDLGNLMDPGPSRIRQSGLIYLRGKCIKHFGSEFSNCTLASGLAKRTAS